MVTSRVRSFAIFLTGTLFGSIFSTVIVFAWTGPISDPPNGNVSAPINIGTTDQVKNAGLSVNSLAVFGNSILSGTTNYLNFGTVVGSTGYGIRNNSGIMELKNSGGSWAALGGAGVQWVTSGANLYYNAGNVAVGSTTFPAKFTVEGGGGIGVYGLSSTSVGVYGRSRGANYGVSGESSGNYGIYGKTTSATYGGVLGYNAAGTAYGILGYGTGNSFSGTGILYNVGQIHSASGGFKFPDGTVQTTAGTGVSSYTHVACTVPMGGSCTATCPAGWYRSGCDGGGTNGTAPSGNGCFCSGIGACYAYCVR